MPSTKNKFLSHFDDWTLAKGEDYFQRNFVLFCKLRSDLLIEAIVRNAADDSRYYVLLKPAKDGTTIDNSICNCPMRSGCKHCAAAALKFLYDKNNSDENNVQKNSSNENVYEITSNDTKNQIASVVIAPSTTNSKPTLSGSQQAARMNSLEDAKRSFDRLAYFARRNGLLPAEFPPTEVIPKSKSKLIYIIGHGYGSRPEIRPCRISLRKDGSYGSESIIRFEMLLDNKPPAYATELDLEIASLWDAARSISRYNSMSNDLDGVPEVFEALLSKIINTGRCHFETTDSPPLKLGGRLEGRLIWEEYGEDLRLAIKAVADGADLPCLRWRTPWYIQHKTSTCGPVNLNIPKSVIDLMLGSVPIPKENLPRMQAYFATTGLDSLLPEIQGQQKFKTKFIKPKYSISIDSVKSSSIVNYRSQDGVFQDIPVRMLKVATSLPALTRSPIVDEDNCLIVERHEINPPSPRTFLEKLGFHPASLYNQNFSPGAPVLFAADSINDWANFATNHLHELDSDYWNVPDNIAEQLGVNDFNLDDLTLEANEDDTDSSWWLSMSLSLKLKGKTFSLLPILMTALDTVPANGQLDKSAIDRLNYNGQFICPMPNGEILRVPFERIRPILVLVQEMLTVRDKSKTSKVSILDLLQLMQAEQFTQARWLIGQKITAFIECLKELVSIPQVMPPKKFKAILRPYQIEGLSWLQVIARNEFGGVLADDMGLGKTIQLLAHICLEKEKKRLTSPFLVICPTSVLPNWIAEAEKFCPHLRAVAYSGLDRQKIWSQIPSADLIVTTYSLVARDLEQLKSIHWHGVALDESQQIKNYKSQIAQVIGSIPANHRICMTGTPIENHLGELWSQFHFIQPGLLGDLKYFNSVFRRPIEAKGDNDARTKLTRRIRPFTLRRTKDEVAAELPEKTTIIENVELDGAQRDLYEAVRLIFSKKVRQEIATKGFQKSQIYILEALLRLRQVCCDPRLVKLDEAKKVKSSVKLNMLTEKLAELVEEGRKVLVFSQFTSMLDLIGDELNKNNISYVELRGDTADRATPVNQFQEGVVPVFLISLKAGGVGLNLTAADTVIHYDPWWNPAVEEQATDRAHRIGQTKKVFVYKLIAAGTIEQRMLELQERKRNLSKSIMDETGTQNMAFSEQDLEYLLSPIG